MRTRILILLAVAGCLAAPASASAAFQHVVAPGESLNSVAAADGLSVAQLAAANGISPESELTAGTRLAIPPQGAPATATAGAASHGTAATPATSTGGSYLVRPGDTLSAIAARSGVSVASLAAANGMSVDGVLLTGRSLSLAGAPASSTVAPATTSAPATSSAPTAETVTSADVASAAARAGVSSSLAEAIGYQESGFNNAEVSRTGATGVMQIEPGTWDYIHDVLGAPDEGTGAAANVTGGVTLLHSLLAQTGGDETTAIAGYYQGLESVREHGMYPDTRAYVRNVLALRSRFGG